MKKAAKLIWVIVVFTASCVSSKLDYIEMPVTGDLSLKQLKKTLWFEKEYKSYKPNKNILDSVTLKNYNITIIGGNWCSDTRMQLPRFIKIIEYCGYNKKSLKIMFVDRKKRCSNCTDTIGNYKVKFIPIFIILNEKGEEIGRITETPQKTLEEDLKNIIMNKP